MIASPYRCWDTASILVYIWWGKGVKIRTTSIDFLRSWIRYLPVVRKFIHILDTYKLWSYMGCWWRDEAIISKYMYFGLFDVDRNFRNAPSSSSLSLDKSSVCFPTQKNDNYFVNSVLQSPAQEKYAMNCKIIEKKIIHYRWLKTWQNSVPH